jgi:anti-sigma factor RsiW
MNDKHPDNPDTPVTEADLLAYVDGQLAPARHAEVEAWLASHADEAQRVAADQALNQQLRGHFGLVLEEPLPLRLLAAAHGRRRSSWRDGWRLAAAFAGVMLLAGGVGGVLGWGLRGEPPPVVVQAAPGFAQRAMVAHAVFAPDQRRAVEVDALHEDLLVRWLSKRLGAPLRVPQLQTLGYALEGGRLLPGGQGPVAQFMYRDEAGARLTLYVSNEAQSQAPQPAQPRAASAASAPHDAAFRFAQEGTVNSFYWVDGAWGYAISAAADRQVLARVSNEVYRQLSAPPAAGSAQ